MFFYKTLDDIIPIYLKVVLTRRLVMRLEFNSNSSLEFTQAMKQYVRTKIMYKSAYFSDEAVITCNCVLESKIKKVSMRLSYGNYNSIIKEEDTDFYKAVDRAINRLTKKYRNNRDKTINIKRNELKKSKKKYISDIYTIVHSEISLEC